MCGILGIVARSPVNQLLYDGLLLLQHRGQDAAGIATSERKTFHMQKGNGQVRDVFRTRNMRSLPGNMGIAHCRYPTAGSASNSAEAQPFYVNSPFGIVLAHNGNLINSEELKEEIFSVDDSIRAIQIKKIDQLRAERNADDVAAKLKRLESAAHGDQNLMPLIIDCVEAYATLGEIADAFRRVFGEFGK